MTLRPNCDTCAAHRLAAGFGILAAIAVPVATAGQAGWHDHDREEIQHETRAAVNVGISASAAVRDSAINTGSIIIRTDQVPDRRDR